MLNNVPTQTSYRPWVQFLAVPIGIFIASRIALIVFQAVVISMGGKAAIVPWTDPWLRWDALFYTSIAESGYTFSTEVYSSAPFFPLYPTLVRFIAPVVGGVQNAALWVSNLSLLGAMIALYALTRHETGRQDDGRRAIMYLILYPMACFFTAGYAESLFLLTTIGCMYFARTRRWIPAIIVGMLASVTRISGGLMLGVIWLEWASSHGVYLTQIHKRTTWATLWNGWRSNGWVIVASLGIPLMLLSFMAYMNVQYGSWTAFVDAHAAWRGQASFQTTLRELGAVLSGQTDLFHLRLGTVALIGLIFLIIPAFRLRASYGWYLMLSGLMPLASGLYSYMRVVGGIFPIFLVLAIGLPANRRLHIILMNILLLMQVFILWLFLNGGFIS